MKTKYEINKEFIENTLNEFTNRKYSFEDLESSFQRIYYYAGYQNSVKVFRVFGYIREIKKTDSGEERKGRKKVQLFHTQIREGHDYFHTIKTLIEFCERFEQIRLINKIEQLDDTISTSSNLTSDILNMTA